MATNYPAAPDNLGDAELPATMATAKTHSNQHNDANDAIDAIQDFLGYPASSATNVQRFANDDARDALITSPTTGMCCAVAGEFQTYRGGSWVPSSGVRLSYTPVLKSQLPFPALGTGGTIVGEYVRWGDCVTVWVRIVFGTSGASAGTGTYNITLPFDAVGITGTSAAAGNAIGSGTCRDATGSVPYPASVIIWAELDTVALIVGSAVVSATAPFAWTNNDILSFCATYPVV